MTSATKNILGKYTSKDSGKEDQAANTEVWKKMNEATNSYNKANNNLKTHTKAVRKIFLLLKTFTGTSLTEDISALFNSKKHSLLQNASRPDENDANPTILKVKDENDDAKTLKLQD